MRWTRLKLAMRDLVSHDITTTCHSDWSGCAKTRRSKTSLVLRYVGSTFATKSRAQGGVSKSSTEAECFAIVPSVAVAKQVF